MLAQHEHKGTERGTSGFFHLIIQMVQQEVRKSGQNEGTIPRLCVCAASDGAYCEGKRGNSLKIPQLFYENIIILLWVYIKFANLLDGNI